MTKKKTTGPECRPQKLPELIQSPVEFREEPHGYHYGDKKLSGITSLLERQLFADKYDGIPKHILDAAAERGTTIHNLCEFEDETGLAAEHENHAYADAAHRYTFLRTEAGFRPVTTEYTVSDLQHVASRIDAVWSSGTDFILCDIKTTQKYDALYLRWQLSVYAYLFERQNMGASVGGLYAAWLPTNGLSRLLPVERIPDEEVCRLLAADAAGSRYDAPEGLAPARQVEARDAWLPDVPADYLEQYLNAVSLLKEAEKTKKDIEEAFRRSMALHGVKSVDRGDVKITYVAPSESMTFDAKAFAADHPDLYEDYRKATVRKDSVKVTIR